METQPRHRIEFTPPAEREAHKLPVTATMFLEGRLYASQNWAKASGVKRAKDFVSGMANIYKPSEPVVAYAFQDEEGRECILMGDGHHRVGESLIEGKKIEAEIDAKLGILGKDLLEDPKKAAQAFGVIGIEGIWPFKTFMSRFTDARIDLNSGK